MARTSTLPEQPTAEHQRRALLLRRVGLALLSLVVLAGATGLLGTRTSETSSSGGGYVLEVVYPSTTRSGHAVKVEVTVRRAGGFPADKPVRLRFRSAYFDLFDENAFAPQPDSETSDEEWTYDEFAAPPGDVLRISVDTRVEPARNRGERGEVAVLDDAGSPVVTARFRTRLFP